MKHAEKGGITINITGLNQEKEVTGGLTIDQDSSVARRDCDES